MSRLLSASLLSLSFLYWPLAEAKRPKKKDFVEEPSAPAMQGPDLQAVLGNAYDAPPELSDRATPGAVIEVTPYGYRPITADCVGREPVESAFTNITMQSSLSGGVSYGFGGQGASAGASKSLGLKFISPYILGFEMASFAPSTECREILERYAQSHSLANIKVVQEALFARINGCKEVSANASGKIGAVGGEVAASTSCQMFSNTAVAVGVRLVSVQDFLSSTSANPEPEPVDAFAALAQEGEAVAAHKAKAKADWEKVMAFKDKDNDLRKKVLSAFIDMYGEQTITVGDQMVLVEIPELALAEQMIRVTKYDGFETYTVDGGQFQMGCATVDSCYSGDDMPRHDVMIGHGLEVMTTEVTQGLYTAIMGKNPSDFTSCGLDCPVENVDWYEVVNFANALSKREGLENCYSIDGENVTWSNMKCAGWRLPTEAEWEYLARGGEVQLYAGSNTVTEVGWFQDNSGDKTHPVGQKQPNGFGLYDMTGNVAEWVWDIYGPYSAETAVDPLGPSEGDQRNTRGGSYNDIDFSARISYRGITTANSPILSYKDRGFRLVRTQQ